MNRFKEYVREKGVLLENDFDTLPYNGIEEVVVAEAYDLLTTKED